MAIPLAQVVRLVPQHRMRAMVYTAAAITAQELHHFGSVLDVVPHTTWVDSASRTSRTWSIRM